MPSAPESKLSNRSSVLAPDAVLQNRYRILRQLGRGGMGAVYEAIDLRLDAVVALKETFSVDEVLRRQFEQEARLLAQLHHPALPRVSDYFTEGDRAFLVMQFIAGVDLAEIIVTQPGPFPRSQVIAWADQLLDALMYLHTRDRQIIHRDIKPHNLKVTAHGQIALLDFGLAKAQTMDATGGNSVTSIFGYTRRYSPLEQIQDQGTTPQSDIYALGATLYHLLTGVKPQDALARAAALVKSELDPLRPAHEVHRAVGSELAAVLTRAMALSQKDRYLTAGDFREALRGVGRSETSLTNNYVRRIAESTSNSTLNPTVVRQVAAASFDPFDSYSILKPAELAWVGPKASRQPAAIAGVLAVFLMVSAGAFYSLGQWVDSKASLVDYPKASSGKNESGAATGHQTKPEKLRLNGAGPVTAPATSTSETSPKSEKQKRPARRADSAGAKTADVKPPPFSILP